MNLTEIISNAEWARIEKKINDRFGLNTCIFDTDGFRLTAHQQWPNRLCPAIKANPKGQSFICAVAHMNIAMQAQRTRQPVIEACDASLMKSVVPIFWREAFVGAVGSCGFLQDNEEVDTFLINKVTGIDEAEIIALSDDIPRVSLEQAQRLNAYIHRQVQSVAAEFRTAKGS
ncbi:MAG: PocR ligand-binding domain-containing protein [Desulfobacterales bacterium]|nr:PocR ligand-binding domain-containing protein [Desulfobacterales bacterium]